MKNTFSRGDCEFQSENDPIFSTNDQTEIVGSNPTLSASLRRAYGWRAESTVRLKSANKPGMTLRRLPTVGSAKVGFDLRPSRWPRSYVPTPADALPQYSGIP